MFPIIDSDNKVVRIEDAQRKLKITATRLPAVVGKDKYKTEFQVWANIMGIYKEDMTGNKYITAGKLLEPKIIQFLKSKDSRYVTPQEFYGSKILDAFPEDSVLGGIPDLLHLGADGKIDKVSEIKTTSNLGKWVDAPPYEYMIQNAFYSAKYGVDLFELTCLDISSYDLSDLDDLRTIRVHEGNTLTFQYSINKDFPVIHEYISKAREWYARHVETGISPVYDQFLDYAPITAIRDVFETFAAPKLMSELERLSLLVNRKEYLSALLAEEAKEIKKIKQHLKASFAQGLIPAFHGSLRMSLVPGERVSYAREQMEADGVFEKYSKISKTLTFDVEIDKVQVSRQSVPCVRITSDGSVEEKFFPVINGSIIEGIASTLDGVMQVIYTDTFGLAYVQIADTSQLEVFEFAGIQMFDRCILFRRDQGAIASDDMKEFVAEYCREADVTSEFN